MKVYLPNLIWEPMKDPESRFDATKATANLAKVLALWKPCRYESGSSVRGVACDCIGGLFGLIDDLDGRHRACCSPLPADTAMHDRESAISTMRHLVGRFKPNFQVEASEDGYFHVQPGDIIVTGYPHGGPGHVEMVGPQRNTLWHALPGSGFHQTGFGFLEGAQLLWRVYRLGDRWRWA